MINVAVLGCGYWGANLLRNFAENQSFQLVACADTDASRFERLAGRYPAMHMGADPWQILHDDAIDAVAIATPANTHYPLACEALRCGKHIFIEKPLATSTAEATELVELACHNHLTLMVDHTFVYTGAVRKIREIIENNELGEIHYFDSVRINLGLFRHDVNVLWDLVPHDLSIMNFILPRRPVAVSASGGAHITPGVLDMAYVTVHFDDATLGHFHCNWLAPVKVRTIIIGGSKRLVLYDDSEPSEKVKIYDRGIDGPNANHVYKKLVQYRLGNMYAPYLDTREALSLACAHFAECITTGQEPITGGAAGLAVVQILEAAERSINEHSRQVPL